MPVKSIQRHTHNGSDSNKIDFQDISGVSQAIRTIGTSAPLASISDPSGGMTIDAQARTAISDVISRLEALGLIEN